MDWKASLKKVEMVPPYLELQSIWKKDEEKVKCLPIVYPIFQKSA